MKPTLEQFEKWLREVGYGPLTEIQRRIVKHLLDNDRSLLIVSNHHCSKRYVAYLWNKYLEAHPQQSPVARR